MPPKRKANALKADAEPPGTRRRTTRSTAAAPHPLTRASRNRQATTAEKTKLIREPVRRSARHKATETTPDDGELTEHSDVDSLAIAAPGPSSPQSPTRGARIANGTMTATAKRGRTTRASQRASRESSEEDELAAPIPLDTVRTAASANKDSSQGTAAQPRNSNPHAAAELPADANEDVDPIDLLSSSPTKPSVRKTYRGQKRRRPSKYSTEGDDEDENDDVLPQGAFRPPDLAEKVVRTRRSRQVYVEVPFSRSQRGELHDQPEASSSQLHDDRQPEPQPAKRGPPPKRKPLSSSVSQIVINSPRKTRSRAPQPSPKHESPPHTDDAPDRENVYSGHTQKRKAQLSISKSVPARRGRPPKKQPLLEQLPARSEDETLETLDPLPRDGSSIRSSPPLAARSPSPHLDVPVTPRRPLRPAQTSPTRAHATLPDHLHIYLREQKRVVLAALRDTLNLVEDEDNNESLNAATTRDLESLLKATVQRGEGNSCLIIGPRASGKTRVVEDVLASLPGKPIIVRLSGHVQRTDRLALREIARQVAKQTEQAFGEGLVDDAEEEPNPFDDDAAMLRPPPLPPSHLPTLISSLPTLNRPTIIVLDAFELFAEHERQALLYCLLDTSQSCRAGTDTKGLAVIGVTSRVDTLNLLEKRVKSRFSGRMLRTAGPRDFALWKSIARTALLAPIQRLTGSEDADEWLKLWSTAVERFLEDRNVEEKLSDTFELVRDVRLLCRILTLPIAALSSRNPFPTAASLHTGSSDQRVFELFPFLSSLSYPAICLLIAAMHERTAGNDAITFEMLHDAFQTQVRTSASAPVQNRYGGSIGMVGCSRAVLFTAFERLLDTRAFIPVPGASVGSARQFLRYRCMVEYERVKHAVETSKRADLKRWFKKAS